MSTSGNAPETPSPSFGEDGVLPCPVCKKPVEEGQWYIVASQAQETMRTGSPTTGVPQRPVHLSCLVSFIPPAGGGQ